MTNLSVATAHERASVGAALLRRKELLQAGTPMDEVNRRWQLDTATTFDKWAQITTSGLRQPRLPR